MLALDLIGVKVFRYSDETAEAVASGEKLLKESGTIYESSADMMSPEDAKRYLDFLENGSREGLTGAELAGVEKADALLVSQKVGYEDVWDLRNAGDALESGSSSGKYQVGAYQDIKGVEGLDAHHVGQKALMKKVVADYDELTAPAINVPKLGHTKRHPERGIVSRSTKGITNARQLLARDLFELKRVYPDIPNSALKELIDMNKKMYPEMRK